MAIMTAVSRNTNLGPFQPWFGSINIKMEKAKMATKWLQRDKMGMYNIMVGFEPKTLWLQVLQSSTSFKASKFEF